MQPPKKKIKTIEDLVGEEISGVFFVRDYVEIHFDGYIVRALVDPIVIVEKEYKQPNKGYRDALCSLISQKVSRLKVEEGIQAKLETETGNQLIIKLDEKSRENKGPESMHFVSTLDPIFDVW